MHFLKNKNKKTTLFFFVHIVYFGGGKKNLKPELPVFLEARSHDALTVCVIRVLMNVPVCFIVSVQAQSEALCPCKYV